MSAVMSTLGGERPLDHTSTNGSDETYDSDKVLNGDAEDSRSTPDDNLSNNDNAAGDGNTSSEVADTDVGDDSTQEGASIRLDNSSDTSPNSYLGSPLILVTGPASPSTVSPSNSTGLDGFHPPMVRKDDDSNTAALAEELQGTSLEQRRDEGTEEEIGGGTNTKGSDGA